MKSLHQYLTESQQTFKYTIKVAGDYESKQIDLLVHNLKKFDPVSIGEPKSTPIQKDPYGFPGMKNQSVTIIKAEFKYPATEPQIKQVAQLLGFDENCVRVISSDFNDSVVQEVESAETGNDAAAKAASKAYGEQYLDTVVPKKPTIDMPFAAKKTAIEPNKTKEGVQTKSPFSSVKRPAKPQTGASK